MRDLRNEVATVTRMRSFIGAFKVLSRVFPGCSGIFEEREDFFIINHVLLLSKYYIYVRKCLGSLPSLRGFITRVRRVYNIELHIARETDKLATHFKNLNFFSNFF